MWDTHPQQARRGYSQVSADATLFPYVERGYAEVMSRGAHPFLRGQTRIHWRFSGSTYVLEVLFPTEDAVELKSTQSTPFPIYIDATLLYLS